MMLPSLFRTAQVCPLPAPIDSNAMPVGTSVKVRDWIQEELDKRGEKARFSIASNPEFLREGAAVSDFMRPDRVVIGTDAGDEQALPGLAWPVGPQGQLGPVAVAVQVRDLPVSPLDSLLAAILGDSAEALADDALLLIARSHADEGDAGLAVAAYERVASDFSDSLLAPRALLMAAELCEAKLVDLDRARRAALLAP